MCAIPIFLPLLNCARSNWNVGLCRSSFRILRRSSRVRTLMNPSPPSSDPGVCLGESTDVDGPAVEGTEWTNGSGGVERAFLGSEGCDEGEGGGCSRFTLVMAYNVLLEESRSKGPKVYAECTEKTLLSVRLCTDGKLVLAASNLGGEMRGSLTRDQADTYDTLILGQGIYMRPHESCCMLQCHKISLLYDYICAACQNNLFEPRKAYGGSLQTYRLLLLPIPVSPSSRSSTTARNAQDDSVLEHIGRI